MIKLQKALVGGSVEDLGLGSIWKLMDSGLIIWLGC